MASILQRRASRRRRSSTLVVRVAVREVFPNCPRYIQKLALVERSRFVPKAGCETPVPAWKRSEWAADAVSHADPSKDPKREALNRR